MFVGDLTMPHARVQQAGDWLERAPAQGAAEANAEILAALSASERLAG